MKINNSINNDTIDVEQISIKSENLPNAFNGYKIVLLSDFHAEYLDTLYKEVKSQNPDIICITGDMTHDTLPFDDFYKTLKELITIAPVYMVSGNHDIWQNKYVDFVNKCKEIGANYLINESIVIEKECKHISISGIEDPYSILPTRIKRIVNKSFTKLKPIEYYSILLFHRANLIDLIKNRGFDLVLSGHMHGGLIRLKKLGAVLSPKSNIFSSFRFFFPKYTSGLYQFRNVDFVVSRGLGNPSSIPRINNPRHICSITLKATD